MNLLKEYSKYWIYAPAGVFIFVGVWKMRHYFKSFDNQTNENQVMKGVVTIGFEGLKDIRIVEDLQKPSIKDDDEILIQVKATAIDVLDLKITQGYGRVLRRHLNRFTKHAKGEFPVILGRDAAGIVEEVGKEVTSVDVGEEVWFFSNYWQSGLMAEYVVVKESQVNKKPKNLTFEQAASLPYVGILTLDVLLNQAKLDPESTRNKRILVHAGHTAYGILAIQLIKLWGGHVTTTVPTFGLPLVRLYGADDVIVYSVTDFKTELQKRIKYDIILNPVGTFLHESCLDICSSNGRVVSIVNSPFIFDSCGILMGTVTSAWMKLKFMILELFGKTSWNYMTLDTMALNILANMIENEELEAVVEQVYDIEDAYEAFQHLTEETAVGRTVVRIQKNSDTNV
ncbi:reticulon-4-interacting protein 1 homolog, mitochondrial-like [Centruroides vittatus]|uniref:reticulon-4-interacting protein 1 homolog, mitochondrial-like n=1 Tax=Centruroides vittatus TaxID=120091 RepID=UPI003510A1FF